MIKFLLRNYIIILIFFYSINANANNCKIKQVQIDNIFTIIKNGQKDYLAKLPQCYKNNRKLMLKLALFDPEQFLYASDLLKNDELFINRILNVHESILKYASLKLKNNIRFMQDATYIQRDSLQYASKDLKDNKDFMTKMITIDSRNYIFASDRLKSDLNIAKIAFSDNGLLIKEAPEDIKSNVDIAKIALKANSGAIEFVSKKIRKHSEIKQLALDKAYVISKEKLRDFLIEHYTETKSQKGLAINIINQGKFFKDNIYANRNFITKWRRSKNSILLDNEEEKISLIEVQSRNLPISWRHDFKNYPLLTDKVANFFKKHNIDDSTINNLKTTFFWLIKNDLPTVAFNIYGIRSSKYSSIGPDFSDVTSLTAIAQKQGQRWNMSVIEVIFSSEVKTDIAYSNGHKKFILWDLYKNDENDQSPKVIFKVEDKFREYFEVYEEQSGGKYNNIFSLKLY